MAAATRWPRLLRRVLGAVVLGAVLVRVGPTPVGRGLASVDLPTVGVALVATLVGTLASARRWVELARRAGLELPLADAVRAYYRSQLLNAVLPSGVVGDVDRAVRHGRRHGRVRAAGRTVVLDRLAGQGAAMLLTAVVLGVAGGPLVGRLGEATPWVAATAFAGLALALVREPVLVATSIVAAVSHAVTFVAAAAAVGVPGRPAALLAVALVVLAGGAIPLNVAGWGPREGVAAWAFGVVGLGAGVGVAVAVVHGIVTLVSVAPGLAFLSAREPSPEGQPAAVGSVGAEAVT
jgi:hypothetical protein